METPLPPAPAPPVDIDVPAAAPEADEKPFLTLSNSEKDWLLVVSYLHLEQRKPEQACVLLRLLHRAFPQDAEVQRVLALGEMLAGHPVEASRAATRALTRAEPKLRVPVGL